MSVDDSLRVGWLNGLEGVPREQKMLKGHLPRVIYYQVHQYDEYNLRMHSKITRAPASAGVQDSRPDALDTARNIRLHDHIHRLHENICRLHDHMYIRWRSAGVQDSRPDALDTARNIRLHDHIHRLHENIYRLHDHMYIRWRSAGVQDSRPEHSIQAGITGFTTTFIGFTNTFIRSTTTCISTQRTATRLLE